MARKVFLVTDERREQVRSLAARGVRQEDIGPIIHCGDTKTLRKHFRDELDRGMAEANSNVTGALYEKAMGGDTIAQMFWMKTRAGWREKDSEKPIPGPEAQQTDNVIVLPDNNRDPVLTEELRKTQDNYYAKKQRRQSRNQNKKSGSDQ
jgi:hypothetical protein